MPYLDSRMLATLSEKLEEGWFHYREFVERFGGSEQALRALLDLYSQGLLDIRGEEEFLVTDYGRRIVEAWRSAGEPRVDPWLDSRIYSMLYASVRAGGRVPGEWRKLLEERGFMIGEELAPSGYIVYEVYGESPKRLVVTKVIAAALLEVPEGPAEKTFYATKWLDTLEAMGLLAKSVVNTSFYALTGPGRLLRMAFQRINIDAPYPALVNPGIIEALKRIEKGERLEEEKEKMLGVIGYLSGTGKLTYAARLVLRAYELLNKPIFTPPTALSRHELRLMEAVREQWEKAKTNPELVPTRKLISEKLEPEWKLKHYSIGLTLYQLEALGLIREEINEKGKQVIKLTPFGERVLNISRGRETTAVAVKALVEADSGRSPSERWISLAQEQGVLGPGGPTSYGLVLARASREAERSILVTNLEALILKRLPDSRSIPRDDLVKSLVQQGFEEEEVRTALDKLESKGLIETRLDDRVEISSVGLIVKQALLGVPSGVATPVHPHLIRVLEAIKKLGTEDVAELVNETRLDLDTVKTAIILARACKYLGRYGTLTAEGEALLEAVKLLRSMRLLPEKTGEEE